MSDLSSVIYLPWQRLAYCREKCIDSSISRGKEYLTVCDRALEDIDDFAVGASLMYFPSKCIDESPQDILRRGLLAIARLDERGHERREILCREWHTHTRKCHRSSDSEYIFDHSLVERYTYSHGRVT